MKILIVQPWIRLGGAEMVSVNLAVNLVHQGHEVEVACTFLDLEGTPHQASELRYLLPPPWVAELMKRSRVMFLLLGPWILFWIVWRNSRDVDILNPHEFPSSWIAALVGKLRSLPVIWTSYGPTPRLKLSDIPRLGFGDWIGWTVASCWLDRVLVRMISSIHVPSHRSHRQIGERYGRDAREIPLGVDAAFYQGGDARQCLLKYGLAGKYVLLCVGKIHPQENQLICLEALRSILPRVQNAFLILAGDGPMRARWQEAADDMGISPHVKFLGHVSAQEVRDLYRACAVHLYPPVNESWGLTPFEALCAGRISIVSDESGAAEIIAREGIGVVCKPTPEAFAREVLRVHDAPGCLEEMARRGRAYVSDRLGWDRYAVEVIRIMSEVRSQDSLSPVGTGGEEKAAG